MSASPIELRGMTWNHSRGFVPMVATAQRFEELNPQVRIVWEKRSLKDFEEYPVEVLAKQYDLIVIDHPFVGFAAAHRPLLALDEHLPPEFLADQQANQVGFSHDSYFYDGHQWALAIDAAAPVALWREDLLERHGLEVPRTWEAVLALAETGHVEVPAAPIYCLMNFYSLCLAHGEEPFAGTERIVNENLARRAIADLRDLLDRCDPGCRERNPIESHDILADAANQKAAYCPLAYGYSNYGRSGYGQNVLRFGEPPLCNGQPFRPTLGGTGLALSAHRPAAHRETALAYAQFTAAPGMQRTLFTHAGGQPAHRSAWLDETCNHLCENFFRDTLPAMERCFIRPRHAGYTRFQEEGGPILHAALCRALDDDEAIRQLDALYRATLEGQA